MDIHADRKVEARPLTPVQLKDLSARSNAPGLVRSITHYGAVALIGILIWQVMAKYGGLFAVPLIVVQGYLVAFLFMAVHEAAHKTVFKARLLNFVLGHLSSVMIALPYVYYALFHWDH